VRFQSVPERRNLPRRLPGIPVRVHRGLASELAGASLWRLGAYFRVERRPDMMFRPVLIFTFKELAQIPIDFECFWSILLYPLNLYILLLDTFLQEKYS